MSKCWDCGTRQGRYPVVKALDGSLWFVCQPCWKRHWRRWLSRDIPGSTEWTVAFDT
jgi:hypothetical protein